MAKDNDKKEPDFDGKDQREKMQEEFQKERETTDQSEFTKTQDELSLGNSIRTHGEVSGTTFGIESSTAKFSNIGQKNQARKGEGDTDIEDYEGYDPSGDKQPNE